MGLKEFILTHVKLNYLTIFIAIFVFVCLISHVSATDQQTAIQQSQQYADQAQGYADQAQQYADQAQQYAQQSSAAQSASLNAQAMADQARQGAQATQQFVQTIQTMSVSGGDYSSAVLNAQRLAQNTQQYISLAQRYAEQAHQAAQQAAQKTLAISVSPTSKSVNSGESVWFDIKVRDQDGNGVSGAQVSINNGASSVTTTGDGSGGFGTPVTVSKSFTFAASKSGYVNSNVANSYVTVQQAAQKALAISVSPTSKSVNSGESVWFDIRVRDQDGNGVSGAQVSINNGASSVTTTGDGSGGFGTPVTASKSFTFAASKSGYVNSNVANSYVTVQQPAVQQPAVQQFAQNGIDTFNNGLQTASKGKTVVQGAGIAADAIVKSQILSNINSGNGLTEMAQGVSPIVKTTSDTAFALKDVGTAVGIISTWATIGDTVYKEQTGNSDAIDEGGVGWTGATAFVAGTSTTIVSGPVTVPVAFVMGGTQLTANAVMSPKGKKLFLAVYPSAVRTEESVTFSIGVENHFISLSRLSQNNPVKDATVYMNGIAIGTTDRNGFLIYSRTIPQSANYLEFTAYRPPDFPDCEPVIVPVS